MRKRKRKLSPEELSEMHLDESEELELSDESGYPPDTRIAPRSVEVAVATGFLTAHARESVQEAKRLFVIELYTLPDVASTIKVPLSVVERWANLFGWFKDRQSREKEVYTAMGMQMSSVAETLGVRTDELASNLEGSIEAYLSRLRDSQSDMSPAEVSKLTRALKDLYELRRTIHGKEGKVDKKLVEFQPSSSFMDTLKKALGADPAAKRLPSAANDAEFEVVD